MPAQDKKIPLTGTLFTRTLNGNPVILCLSEELMTDVSGDGNHGS